MTSFRALIDKLYPPGTPERAEHDRDMARFLKRHRRQVRLLGWMNRIPPRWACNPEDQHHQTGMDLRCWHGAGPTILAFWWAVLDGESRHGVLDAVAFRSLDDRYVPHFREGLRRIVRRWGSG